MPASNRALEGPAQHKGPLGPNPTRRGPHITLPSELKLVDMRYALKPSGAGCMSPVAVGMSAKSWQIPAYRGCQ